MMLPTNKAGHLTIGGVDAVSLAHRYQTPLVVYDVALIRSESLNLNEFLKNKLLNMKSAMLVKHFVQ